MIRGGTEQSSPKTATWLNRIRHHEGATGATTLRNSVEREGKKLREVWERVTTDILRREGFDETGQPLPSTSSWSREVAVIPAEQVKKVIDACPLEAAERAEVEHNPLGSEQPTETVNISIDDVVVKQPKVHRTSPENEDDTVAEAKGRHDVHTTVAHLQHQGQPYGITGQGAPTV